VDQREAEKALAIIRGVIQNTREDLVAHNWGAIWIVHSFANLAATAAGFIVESNELGIFWYFVPLVLAAVVNLLVVLLLVKRDQGVRSFVEWQIHGIWWTFMVFTAVAALVLYSSGASPRLFCPVFAMTSGIGFAMMGVVFYRRFFIFAALFLVVMLVGPFLPKFQWLLLAPVWWAATFIPGLNAYREKQLRDQDASRTTIL
jgi:hypothetical protein